MSLTKREIDQRAQVLADYITLSTLESELQDARDSGAYEGELAGCIDVLQRAVDLINGDDFSLRPVNTAAEARDLAIEYQNWASEQSLTYGELAYYQDHFKKLAKKFNLTEEFKENAII